MIKFKDFVPEEVEAGGFFRQATYEELNDTVDRANTWIHDLGLELVNIETVVLPNMHSPHEEGSQDTQLSTSGEMHSSWHQFIRVWYREG